LNMILSGPHRNETLDAAFRRRGSRRGLRRRGAYICRVLHVTPGLPLFNMSKSTCPCGCAVAGLGAAPRDP
jgi:hypothetical protein